jgi:hypothetical protein
LSALLRRHQHQICCHAICVRGTRWRGWSQPRPFWIRVEKRGGGSGAAARVGVEHVVPDAADRVIQVLQGLGGPLSRFAVVTGGGQQRETDVVEVADSPVEQVQLLLMMNSSSAGVGPRHPEPGDTGAIRCR